MDKTLISIEMIDGVKYIHFLGYGYFCGEPSDKPYRWVDYTFLMCPIEEAIKYGVSKWESDYQDSVKQYIQDLSESDYNTLEEHEVISVEDIAEGTPCGLYYLVLL